MRVRTFSTYAVEDLGNLVCINLILVLQLHYTLIQRFNERYIHVGH